MIFKTPLRSIALCLLFIFSYNFSLAQVGIGTISPDPSSLLHVDNGSGDKGLLVPSVELTASNIGDPITPTPASGLLVYNTATAGSGSTAVFPGYYFWNGSEWMSVQSKNKWDIKGNWSTDENLDYLGTNDDTALTFRTNEIERFRIGKNDQVLAMADGNAVEPFYTWNSDKSMGFWKSGDKEMGMAIDGSVFYNASAYTAGGSNIEWIFNPEGKHIDLRVETDNNTKSLVISGVEGTIGMGSLPYNDTALRVNNSAEPFGIISETSGNGVAVYGIETGGGRALAGENYGTGLGIFGYAANTHGIYGTTAYTGGSYLTGGIVGWGTGDENANGVLAVTDKPAASQSNIGIRAVSGGTTSYSRAAALNIGVNTNATDLALYALTQGPILVGSTLRDFDAATFQTNYYEYPTDPDARDPRARIAGFVNNGTTPLGTSETYYGAYLYSGGSTSNSSYAYAGARHNGVNYKIIGNGVVSTIVEGTDDEEPRIMFAPEAPEVLFEDYGTAQLNNGIALIDIDPLFTKNITVDATHTLKVFIQLEGDCNGVFVTNKTAEGFTVKELQNGSSNTTFSWHIVANRKNSSKGRSAGNSSDYSNLRFPYAPKAHELNALETKQINAEKTESRNNSAQEAAKIK